MKIKKLIPDWLWQPNVFPRSFSIWFVIIATEASLLGFLWIFHTSPLIPRPMEILHAFPGLVQRGLVYHLVVSYRTYLIALGCSMVISVGLGYFSRFAIGYPVAYVVGLLRFLGTTGFIFVFTLLIGGGQALKVVLLTFSISVFFTKDMMTLVRSVPQEIFDHNRTLGMSQWQVLYEVVIRGTFHQIFDVLKQNAAMGFVMLGMVEATVRSGGGIGTVLVDSDRTLAMAVVFAAQLSIFFLGGLQDALISFLKNKICRYARYTEEKR